MSFLIQQPTQTEQQAPGLTADEAAQLAALQAKAAAAPDPVAQPSGADVTAEGVVDTSGAPQLTGEGGPLQPGPDGRGISTAGMSADEVRQVLNQFVAEQSAWRAQALKEITTAGKIAAAPRTSHSETEADRKRARDLEINAHPYYCANCGRFADYLKECVGPQGRNHPPMLVSSTDELKNAPDPLEKDKYLAWQQNHTAAPDLTDLLAAAA